MKIMKTTSLKLFQPAALAALAIITLWGVSIRPAQAGYTVTLQQVGPNVVATGSGPLDLTGLTFLMHGTAEPIIKAANPAFILTGAVLGLDIYERITGPTSFGSGDQFFADSGGGNPVGMRISDMTLGVPRGYVSGAALSSNATWNNATLATLGVTPGTYVWTWGTGANQNFTLKILAAVQPPNGPPIVTTNPAALIASFSATLKGSLNPHGLSTTFHFEYGTTTSYGLTTAPQTQTGNTSRPVSANINSLAAQTTYHFRIVASNTAGTRFGSDRIFTTLIMTGPPVVTTNPATNVTASSARLNGRLDPHGLSTTVYFQYGTTTSYGSRTPNQIKTGNNYQNVFAALSSLTAGTTYHFRIVATNTGGTRVGSDRTFTTP
jgi:hypothetical protein